MTDNHNKNPVPEQKPEQTDALPDCGSRDEEMPSGTLSEFPRDTGSQPEGVSEETPGFPNSMDTPVPDAPLTENFAQSDNAPIDLSGLMQTEPKKPQKKIFIVLSRRDEMNQDCIAAILKMGVGYIVLNDPASYESITERLNTHPRVRFALVLLSGDDFIYDRLTGKPATAQLGPKADVVFHLGYVLAQFGHIGTLAIYREQRSFHLPTGQHHTIFVPYRKGGSWEEILKSKLQHINVL